MDFKKTYSFGDVLLEPKFSDIDSRWTIDIGNDLDALTHLKLPVISSPMDTVKEGAMALAMASAGGLGIVHRYTYVRYLSRQQKPWQEPSPLP